jgi:hypothetical protein
MQTVTAFSASAVPRNEWRYILADYVELDRARIRRRSRVTRFGWLVAGTMVIGAVTDVLSPVQQCIAIGLLLISPAWAWLTELGLETRLSRRLQDVDGVTQQLASAGSSPGGLIGRKL